MWGRGGTTSAPRCGPGAWHAVGAPPGSGLFMERAAGCSGSPLPGRGWRSAFTWGATGSPPSPTCSPSCAGEPGTGQREQAFFRKTTTADSHAFASGANLFPGMTGSLFWVWTVQNQQSPTPALLFDSPWRVSVLRSRVQAVDRFLNTHTHTHGDTDIHDLTNYFEGKLRRTAFPSGHPAHRPDLSGRGREHVADTAALSAPGPCAGPGSVLRVQPRPPHSPAKGASCGPERTHCPADTGRRC